MESFYILIKGEATLKKTFDLMPGEKRSTGLMQLNDTRSTRTFDLVKLTDWSLIGVFDLISGRNLYDESCIFSSDEASYYKCPAYLLDFFTVFGLFNRLDNSGKKVESILQKQKTTISKAIESKANLFSGVAFSREAQDRLKSVRNVNHDTPQSLKLIPSLTPGLRSSRVVIQNLEQSQRPSSRSLQGKTPSMQNFGKVKKPEESEFSIKPFTKNYYFKQFGSPINKGSFQSRDFEKYQTSMLEEKSEIIAKTMEEIDHIRGSCKSIKNGHTKHTVFITIPKLQGTTERKKFPSSLDVNKLRINTEFKTLCTQETERHPASHRSQHKEISKSMMNVFSVATEDSRPKKIEEESEVIQREIQNNLKLKIKPLAEITKKLDLTNNLLKKLKKLEKSPKIKRSLEGDSTVRLSQKVSAIRKDKLIFHRFPEFPQLQSADRHCDELMQLLKKSEENKARLALQNRKSRLKEMKSSLLEKQRLILQSKVANN